MDLEDKEELQEPELDEDLGDEGEPGDEERAAATPAPLNDQQVVDYLKAQELEVESLDDLRNQGASYKGLQRKYNALNSQLDTLRKHPKFPNFLQEAYSDNPPEKSSSDLPELLQNMPPQQLENLKKVIGHLVKPELSDFEGQVGAMVTTKLFETQHPDIDKYEEKMVEIMGRYGIRDRSFKTLEFVYNRAKEEEQAGHSSGNENGELKPGLKTKQIGISPKSSERTGSKITGNKGSEEFWKQKMISESADEEEE